LLQKLYKYTFWFGYTAVLITSILQFSWQLDKVHINLLAFNLRLDHLLHLAAYFLICMYFLVGQIKGFKLFENHSLGKFIAVTLLLATVTEFVQLWVPTRAFNVLDWVANVAGIVLGVVIIKIKDRRSKIED
jgi:VanZ family protein